MNSPTSRFFGAALGVCAVSACVPPSAQRAESSEWRVVTAVRGCITFQARGHEAVDKNIILAPVLEQALLRQAPLTQYDTRQPICWYLTPGKMIRLDVMERCAGGTSVEFEKVEGVWLSRGESPVTETCSRRNECAGGAGLSADPPGTPFRPRKTDPFPLPTTDLTLAPRLKIPVRFPINLNL